MKKNSKNNSLYEEVINIGKQVKKDTKLRIASATPCKKGCAECCKQYFELAPIEFEVILKHLYKDGGLRLVRSVLSKGDEDRKVIEALNPRLGELLSTVIESKHDKNNEKMQEHINNKQEIYDLGGTIPLYCTFLNQETKSCTIYKYRPLICSSHGVGYIDKDYKYLPCSVVNEATFNRENLINLEYVSEFMSGLMQLESKKYGVGLLDRAFPIFKLCEIYNRLDDKDLLARILGVGQQTKEQYVNSKIELIMGRL